MSDTEVILDVHTRRFVEQLHQTWSRNAPLSAYAAIRDDVLAQRDNIDGRLSMLGTVAKIAHPIEWEGHPQWHNIELTDDADEARDTKKRKRSSNQASRARNLALIAALWSLELVYEYGWDRAGQSQIHAIRACAVRFPDFVHDLLPQLNSVLLQRHREAIADGHLKTLNEAPLQPLRDLDTGILDSAIPDEDAEVQWLTSITGDVPVDASRTMLHDVRPCHFHKYLLRKDRYGMLIVRGEFGRPPTPATTEVASRSPCSIQVALNRGIEQMSDHVSGEPHSPTSSPAVVHEDLTPSTLEESSSCYDRIGGGSLGHDAFHISNQAVQPDLSSLNCSTLPGSVETSIDCQHFDLESFHLLFGHLNHSILDFPFHPMYPPPTSGASTHISPMSSLNEPLPSHLLGHAHSLFTASVTDLSASTSSAFPTITQYLEVPHQDVDESWRSPADDGRCARPARERSPSVSCHLSAGILTHTQVGLPPVPARGPDEGDFTIASPKISPDHQLRMEEILHNQHQTLIASYLSMLESGKSQHEAGVDFDSRRQWLNPATSWAKIFTLPNSRLTRGKAQSVANADVLYFTSDEFLNAAQAGEIFLKPVVIKEQFSDSGMHTVDGFIRLLQDSCGSLEQSPRFYNDEQSTPRPAECPEACESVQRREFNADISMPHRLRNIMDAHRPLLTMLPRYRILNTLKAKVRNPGRSDSSFNVLSLSGSFPGPQLCSSSGTWIRNLDGTQFYTIVAESAMESEWANFVQAGVAWDPSGRERLIVLERDDVLLIPPGSRIVHAVQSPVDCLVDVGRIWDELDLLKTMRSIRWMQGSQTPDDESILCQLPLIIEELLMLAKAQPGRFCAEPSSQAEWLLMFEHAVSDLRALGCRCLLQNREESCDRRRRNRRCTSWCPVHASSC